MASSYVIAGPAIEPVSVAAAMLQLRYDEDALPPDMASKLRAAREQAEHETGRALIDQTRRLELHDWPVGDCGIVLDYPPVKEVASFTYWDGSAWRSVQAPVFELSRLDKLTWCVLRHVGQSWPTLGARRGARIRVDFVAGFGADGDAVPESIKQWIVAHAGLALKPPKDGKDPGEFINRLLDAWRTRL